MYRQFGIQAPSGVLSKYEDLFNAKDIFFSQQLPKQDSTHFILEDSKGVYTDDEAWIGAVSTVISHISSEEMLYVTNQGGLTTLLWKK